MRCEVLKCTNLWNNDVSGKSDPYVKLRLLSNEDPGGVKKSATIEQNLSPEWNEKHSILVKDPTESLEVTVWDYDMVGDDDLMGKQWPKNVEMTAENWVGCNVWGDHGLFYILEIMPHLARMRV